MRAGRCLTPAAPCTGPWLSPSHPDFLPTLEMREGSRSWASCLHTSSHLGHCSLPLRPQLLADVASVGLSLAAPQPGSLSVLPSDSPWSPCWTPSCPSPSLPARTQAPRWVRDLAHGGSPASAALLIRGGDRIRCAPLWDASPPHLNRFK